MMDKETYKKELMRMYAWVRDDDIYNMKECCNFTGKNCNECPIRQYCFPFKPFPNKVGMTRPYDAFEVIEAVERWSKEHQPLKLTRLEYEILKWLDKGGYKFIARSPWNNLDAFDSTPVKITNGFNGWVSETEYKDLTEFNELFQFIKWADEEPTSIQDVLKNCEVKEDV